MATTVKISEETNERLDRLQAKVLLRMGRKLSKQEILERLIRLGLADETLVVGSARRIRYPVPDKAWKKLLRRVVSDWGVVTREEDVDRILYGGSD
ncbi:MAG: hypothetical protein A3K68_07420 [Euryarchaeota archaeon RBG_16_68_13]|nr:MAG: hypothetical protein A3K68_07420 [Euryarchaeota archaeon RBG_16_68_13]